jgi:hypothetical protein
MVSINSIARPTASQSANGSLRFEGLIIKRPLSPKRISVLLTCVSLMLILAGVASKYASSRLDKDGLHQYHIQEMTRQFDLDEENNIPTYYQIVTLLFCSFLLMLISLAKRASGDRYRLHWRMQALMFLFLSIDEEASFHESIIGITRSAFNLDGFFHFAWVLPAIVVVFIVAISYLPFLLSLPFRTRLLFVISGAFYVGGAVGMEMVGGRLLKLYGQQSLQYAAGTIVEEILEMIGVLIFIYALLSYLREQVKEARIEF